MIRKLSFVWMVVLLASGCSKEQSYEPVEINPSIDVCDICNMSITEVNYATEVILTDGTVETFDDIGCMIDFFESESPDVGAAYVKDVTTSAWIKAEEAVYVYHEDYWTPMMNGIVAFQDEETALAFTEKNGEGKQLTYEEVQAHLKEHGGSSH